MSDCEYTTNPGHSAIRPTNSLSRRDADTAWTALLAKTGFATLLEHNYSTGMPRTAIENQCLGVTLFFGPR